MIRKIQPGCISEQMCPRYTFFTCQKRCCWNCNALPKCHAAVIATKLVGARTNCYYLSSPPNILKFQKLHPIEPRESYNVKLSPKDAERRRIKKISKGLTGLTRSMETTCSMARSPLSATLMDLTSSLPCRACRKTLPRRRKPWLTCRAEARAERSGEIFTAAVPISDTNTIEDGLLARQHRERRWFGQKQTSGKLELPRYLWIRCEGLSWRGVACALLWQVIGWRRASRTPRAPRRGAIDLGRDS